MSHSLKLQLPVHFRPYTLSSLFPVLFFSGENWLITAQKPEFFHFHNCFEIGHCISGSGTLCFRDYQLPFSSGQYSIISPLEPHISICEDTPSQWEYIFFDPLILFDSISPAAARLCRSFYLLQKPSRIINENDQSLWKKMKLLFSEFHKKNTLQRSAMHSLFLSILVELDRIPVRSDSQSSSALPLPIHSALLHIYTHYMEPLKISDLAAQCCISESHFRRLFKQLTGLSPQEYLLHYRIQHACHQLLHSTASIHQIAVSVGFSSISSFNRQFTQHTSMPPGEWKKRYAGSSISHTITSLEDSFWHIFHH